MEFQLAAMPERPFLDRPFLSEFTSLKKKILLVSPAVFSKQLAVAKKNDLLFSSLFLSIPVAGIRAGGHHYILCYKSLQIHA